MADKQWHLVENGQQLSDRFSTDEIAAKMKADPSAKLMVWRQGMDGWKAPQDLPEFQNTGGDATPPSAPDSPPDSGDKGSEAVDKIKQGGRQLARGTAAKFQQIKNTDDPMATLPHLKLVDAALDMTRGIFSKSMLDLIDDMCRKFGPHAFGLAALVYVVMQFISLFKADSFSFQDMINPLIFLLGALLGQYLIASFMGSGSRLIEKTPSRFGSRGLLECFAVIAMGAAVLGAIYLVLDMIDQFSLQGLLTGLTGVIILGYLAGVCLSEETINVKVDPEGDFIGEAIGILYFFIKAAIRLVSPVVGLLAIAAFVKLTYYLIRGLFAEGGGMWFFRAEMEKGALVVIALLPIIVYIIFLLKRLWIEVIRAILAVPDKLDNLRND